MRTVGIIISGILTILVTTLLASAIANYLSLEDYLEANVLRVVDNTIIIGNNCTVIVAETSPERAYNIQLGIEKTIPQRPTTYDTISQILKSFNITVEVVKMESFDGNYYYADIYLKNNDKLLKLDIMPSDAIGIALRTNAKIYINKTMLNEIGKNIC